MAAHWRLDPACVFLNHGSFGATPVCILEKQREIIAIMEREPIRFFVEIAEGLLDETRHAIAGLVNADAEGIVHVPNATAGVNTVVRSLRFQPGDELLTNSHEYNACNNVLRWAEKQWGAKMVTVEPPFPVRREQELVDAVLAGVTSRTKLVMLSHITSPTGLIFPVQPIVDELNRCGIESLVDGAHAPGMIPIDLKKLNATYYTGNFHKWLCAPKGAAFLHVREERRADGGVRPLVISHGANSTRTDRSRFRIEFDYIGTWDLSAYLCVPEFIRFLSALFPGGGGGLAGLMKHNHDRVLEGRDILLEALAPLTGQTVPPVHDRMLGSMAALALPDPPRGMIRPSKLGYHDALADDLIQRHGLQVPVMPFPPLRPGVKYDAVNPQKRLIRIAMQAYNSVEQVRYLAECLREELERERDQIGK